MANSSPCPHCGKPVSVEITRCPFCENHIERSREDLENPIARTRAFLKAEHDASETIRCRKCGQEISAFADKCPHCAAHTHHESHFEDRTRGELRFRGARYWFYAFCIFVVFCFVAWVLSDIGPEVPHPREEPFGGESPLQPPP